MSNYAMTCMHGNAWYVFRNLRIDAARRIRRVVISLGIDRDEHRRKLSASQHAQTYSCCICMCLRVSQSWSSSVSQSCP